MHEIDRIIDAVVEYALDYQPDYANGAEEAFDTKWQDTVQPPKEREVLDYVRELITGKHQYLFENVLRNMWHDEPVIDVLALAVVHTMKLIAKGRLSSELVQRYPAYSVGGYQVVYLTQYLGICCVGCVRNYVLTADDEFTGQEYHGTDAVECALCGDIIESPYSNLSSR